MTPIAHPASTVVLLRDADGQLEVFMVRRHEALAFMGGAYVFAGGRVDESDCDGDDTWCDGVDVAVSRLPDCAPREAIGYHVAAVRELFEEAGVLLASGDRLARLAFAEYRADVLADPARFRPLIERERLRLDLAALVPCAHWVTPARLPRRFDTRFFAARMEPVQVAVHDAGETVDSVWIRPCEAIERASAGRMDLPVPTRHMLTELLPFPSVADALDWYATHPIERHEPL